MSTAGDSVAATSASAAPIGPGRLVLIVGPSGAGKDTLLALARGACGRDVLFPRRVVTRQASTFEDHGSLTEVSFARALEQGRFALHWQAHGLRYGIPATIDDYIRAGGTVVCNVSRAIVADARERYACVTAVLITAPLEILAARLRARSRSDDGALADRLRRAGSDAGLVADVVIDNTGTAEAGARKLVAAIDAACSQVL
jgi:ribose 1,5-bisphosphokinase